jgi:hypothetical protein
VDWADTIFQWDQREWHESYTLPCQRNGNLGPFSSSVEQKSLLRVNYEPDTVLVVRKTKSFLSTSDLQVAGSEVKGLGRPRRETFGAAR